MKHIGLYIHIPFCHSFCHYCAFYKVHHTKDKETEFVKALLKEIEWIHLNTEPLLLKSIFFGGGTPTCLSNESWEAIMSVITDRFQLDPDIEITVEANPETITENLLNYLNQLGVNRISIGIQSFNPKELLHLGRTHTQNRSLLALESINNSKINNFNVDFIIGHQLSSIDTLSVNLETVMRYSPTHLSWYSLSIEPGTPFEKQHYQEQDQEKQLGQYQFLQNRLQALNYSQYEISAYSLNHMESKHNLIYWTYSDFIGLGPSANTWFEGSRYSNRSNLDAYCTNPIPQINSPATKIDISIQKSEYIISNLRLINGFSVSDYNLRFNENFKDTFNSEIAELKVLELIEVKKDRCFVTNKGLYLLNDVLERFIP